jgi:hypothetical protein
LAEAHHLIHNLNFADWLQIPEVDLRREYRFMSRKHLSVRKGLKGF